MKRILTLIIALILMIGISVPSASLAASKPKTPSIQKAAAGTNSVTLSWKSVSGARGYEIKWGPKGSPDWMDSSAATTGTQITVNGLSEAKTYAFRIRAYYKSGTKIKYTSWSSKKYVTTAASMPAVPVITGASYANGRVTLTWSSDSRATGYEVSWSEKGTFIPWGSPVDTQNSSMVITNRIVTGTTMAFRVRAYRMVGTKIERTAWSETRYVSTVGSTPPPAPSQGTWGPWSDWSKTKRTVTSNMQEEIRHHWWAAKCRSCGTHNPYWGSNVKCIRCRKALASSNVEHVNVYTTGKQNLKTLNGRSNGRTLDGKNYWYCEIQYRYRTRN